MRRSCPALVLIALLGGCATAPEPSESKPAHKRAAAATEQAPVSAADAGASEHHAAVDSAAEAPPPRREETWGGMGLQEVNEKDWLTGVRNKVAERLKVEPGQLIFSPGKLRVAVVRGPPEPVAARAPAKKHPAKPRPRRFQIIVADNQGVQQAVFRPITAKGSDEPPKDLRFLSEDRLVYEVVATPPPEPAPAKIMVAKTAPARSAKRAAPPRPRKSGHAPRKADKKTAASGAASAPAPTAAAAPAEKPPLPPARLFIIQPLEPRARPIRCEGRYFTFTAASDHLAFVGGTPEAGFVAVDGAPTYPRKGRSVISSPATWSKDGHSLAFLESPTDGPAHLVLLAEFDNPTGDTTWDLPPAVSIEGARVFWAGSGRLVVGKTVTHPIFSASFQKLK
ncbi:MAG TPA: hypothetical protein VNO55_32150 [Polyangia bacterium]|nr:hypothetical protein [Polyangia bacterium]